ncbi:MAG: hypothetical protein PHV16_02260 [Candidatus Nanoarchaeia archaeon]|nr:hypothetical protein [Candidatus Nanoarchaeia archaeon]
MAEKEVVNVIKEWAVTYIKHRDIMLRTLIEINDNGNSLTVKYKDKEHLFILKPSLEESLIQGLDTKTTSIITLNSKENFNFLIDNWKKLVKFENLTFFFINPHSELETKWFISPYVHNKICDEDSFKQGLKSMFDTVEKTSEKEIMKKL